MDISTEKCGNKIRVVLRETGRNKKKKQYKTFEGQTNLDLELQRWVSFSRTFLNVCLPYSWSVWLERKTFHHFYWMLMVKRPTRFWNTKIYHYLSRSRLFSTLTFKKLRLVLGAIEGVLSKKGVKDKKISFVIVLWSGQRLRNTVEMHQRVHTV